jgi:hypothetical protein
MGLRFQLLVIDATSKAEVLILTLWLVSSANQLSVIGLILVSVAGRPSQPPSGLLSVLPFPGG